MHQDLCTVSGGHCYSVLGIEYHGDLTVSRSNQLADCGLDRDAVAEHTACECLVFNFIHEEHLTGQAGAEDFILHLGTCGSGSSGCCSCGSLFILNCGQRDGAVAELLNQLFEVGLDDRYGRSVDDLDTVALDNNAGSAGCLEQRLVDLGGIDERQTKSGSAAVDVAGQVLETADTLEERSALRMKVRNTMK